MTKAAQITRLRMDMQQRILAAGARRFDELVIDGCTPGLRYAVFQGDRCLLEESVGFRSVETREAVGPDTQFRIASMTKSFAAAAVLRLRDEGGIALDMPVERQFPLLHLGSPLGSRTPRQLLSMTAGLATDDPWADRLLGSSDEEYSRILRQEYAPQPGLGRDYLYSNLGYMLLGRIISIAANEPALSFIENQILRPLGLARTQWHPSSEDAHGAQAASGYVKRGDAWVREEERHTAGDGDVFAGLWSTAEDLNLWIQFLLDSPELRRDSWQAVLSAQSRRELQQIQVSGGAHRFQPLDESAVHLEGIGYCFGLRHYRLGKIRMIGHSGGLRGYGSHMRWHPETGIAVLAFANSTYCPVWDHCGPLLEQLVRTTDSASSTTTSILRQRADELSAYLRGVGACFPNELFASNFFKDNPPEQCAEELRALRTFLGTDFQELGCLQLAPATAELRLAGAGKEAFVELSLSPERTAGIQRGRLEPSSSARLQSR